MTTKLNAVIPAEEPKRKKRGGQPGNTNAFELGALKAHQRSAKRHEALA
jgi:hypothetical protein